MTSHHAPISLDLDLQDLGVLCARDLPQGQPAARAAGPIQDVMLLLRGQIRQPGAAVPGLAALLPAGVGHNARACFDRA